MAKTKPKQKKERKREKSVLNRVSGTTASTSSKPTLTPEQLLLQAAASLQQGDLESAAKPAKKALSQLDASSEEALPALNLLGEIHLELGDVDAARQYFMRAVVIDPTGDVDEEVGGGPEKFLWLAQLSEDGGRDSVNWFEKGALALRKQIQSLLDRKSLDVESQAILEEKRRKLSVALCGVVEVYMTDLSWETDAEQKCEQLVTEATMVAEGFAEPWQTLANVRISQERIEDARAALKRSIELWTDLEPDDSKVPDFPTRVSLARLLMETGMDGEAIEVLERLVGEDDQSVEVWYLGGWGLYILGEKQKKGEIKGEDSDSWKVSWISSRQWLNNSMRLFEMQDYEDDRLGEHAKELLAGLNKELGPEGTADEEDGEGWEDAGSDEEDDEMDES